VFAGGKGERFDLGLKLVKSHNIKHIFLSVGAVKWEDQQRLLDYCSSTPDSHTVYCVRTEIDSDNTQGEAQLFANKARELGLNHLVVVTGKSHTFRASLRLSQYFDGSVDKMGADENATIKALVHEWLGIFHAILTR